ncbi:LysR substrate-binding domain-containing protein [Thalassotalea sp. PLHSN55]|uniref:LysR substrate-binding domain-containing protein n=1 Tax=Thalassotalea sp. PLHSN55 TaxID=3435888 RepID=UPI003F85F141
MNITLQQIRVFCTLARTQNLTQAAQLLFLSKGAVSQALGQLEQRLDTQLFDRVHAKLKLNSQGQLLLTKADELLARAQEIDSLFSSTEQNQGQIHLGASQTIGNYLLPQILAKPWFNAQQATKVRVINTQTLCQMVLNFELDLALIEGQNTSPELQAIPWLQDEMILVAAPDHPLAKQQTLPLSALNHQHWILREPNSGSRENFERNIRPAIEHLNGIIELSSLESVLLTVEQGLGISFISNIAAKEKLATGKLVQLPVQQTFTRQLYLLVHKKKYLTGRLLDIFQGLQAMKISQ